MFHLLTPHYRVHRAWELTPEQLRQWGIRALLMDVDCTLTRYRQPEAMPEVVAWIDQLRDAGVRMCLVSNGMSGRIRRFAERLSLPCVSNALKPLPRGVRDALHQLGSLPAETAIIGDQLFADVMAGRLAGVRSILVEPIHPEEEPWYTRLKRFPERLVLACSGTTVAERR
ncbi:MAG: YqeG family HAD IIIA-type phosphatase [Planctomycetaceae bacterium]|nr:YqeG family HAD IIIA-type phosphatase [Planctomycetaceae bacterium]